MDKNRILSLLFLPLSLLLCEIILKLLCLGALTVRGFILTAMFSIAAGALLTFLCALAGRRFRAALIFCAALISVYFAAHYVYHSIFDAFFSLSSFSGAGDAIGSFWREALTGTGRAMPQALLFFLPLAAAVMLRRRLTAAPARPAKLLCAFALAQLAAVLCVYAASTGSLSPKYVYLSGQMPEQTVRFFGIVTMERQELSAMLFGGSELPETTPTPAPSPSPSSEPQETPEPVYEPNIIEGIDFDSLIASETDENLLRMHEHFVSVEPTLKNEYTGLFEGKNLIWIVAEGFSDLALDETHTPMLYKLAHEGFVFNNFYTPSWGVSTSDGEYVTLTGLLPKSGVWSFSKSASNDMGMTFGRMLGALGYDCRAYHDHTYDYYDRDKSHPNMGYIYEGVGNGLDMEPVWPASDLEMVRETVDDYINSDRFHVYYMTVSGHMYYTFTGNTQAWKHRDDVADLPYSDNCRAYIACNMEFDLAVQELIERLDEAGKLEDTVIVISGDHYPYGLTNSEISEIRGHEVDAAFELYRSALIIWSGDMRKPIEVDKYCYAADIMPTLANLFGLEYDSRLLAGRDILSDSEGLVIFANRSFISELGRYDALSGTFYPAEGAEIPENYVASMLSGRVADAFTWSAAILDYDYYAVVLPEDSATGSDNS